MCRHPMYTSQSINQPAFQLRYSWTGWPRSAAPENPNPECLRELESEWEQDGLRLLEQRWTPSRIQFTFSTTPTVSPVFLATRVKGRLQHHLRKHGPPVQFQRKLSVRSLGNNTREQVERYIQGQTRHLRDEPLRELLKEFTVTVPGVDLSRPTPTKSGMYWYNLHLVLVSSERHNNVDPGWLAMMRDESLSLASVGVHQIRDLSVMPDHLHLGMRGNILRSPEEIALEFMNGLATAAGNRAIWQDGYPGLCTSFCPNQPRSPMNTGVVGVGEQAGFFALCDEAPPLFLTATKESGLRQRICMVD